VKTSSHQLTPRRSFWKRRGAFFGGCGVLGALILAVAPRLISNFSLFGGEEIAQPPNPARGERRNRSLSGALAKIDAATIRAYLERWSSAKKAGVSGAWPTIYIDSNALARRHPAWRLADQLERGEVSPSSPQILRALAPISAENRFTGDSEKTAQSTSNRAVSGVIVRDQSADFAADSPQTRGFDRFLTQSAARDALRARDAAFLARRALEDATALARRRAVAEADLPTLSPEELLELLNLRLQLLRNLSRTPAQREAAREEIRAIEARYAALLKRQTQAEAARLRAATLEIPNRLRREGLLRIEAEARISAQKQADLRRELALENRNRARRDFGSLPSLQVELPPLRSISRPPTSRLPAPTSRLPAPTSRLPRSTSRAAQNPADFFETARREAASNAPLEAKTAVLGANRARIAANLREQARAEAAQWARRAASNLGARLSQTPGKNSPDRTEAALQMLFPAVS